MFNLGITEIIALGSLALIVIGPKQLPEVAKVVARVLGELKSATGDLATTLAQTKDEAREAFQDVVGEFDDLPNAEQILNKYAGIDKEPLLEETEAKQEELEDNETQLSFAEIKDGDESGN